MDLCDIRKIGNNLLQEHAILYKKLNQIPESRELIFRIDIEEDLNIGKPRFINRKYLWTDELLTELHDHLEGVWSFFDSYSHWVDNSLISIISYTKRSVSKKSIIFLLENDVWETDEVYGDYLIEKMEGFTMISYFRFDKKIKSFKIDTIEKSKIEKWICNDAISQIQEQFSYLWSKIETEIKTCIEEKYHKKPKLLITSDYLIEQLNKTRQVAEYWPEAALLSLGRICEMWLLIELELENTGFNQDLLKLAERFNIVDKNEFKFLKKIRKNYNDLKHKRYFYIEKKRVLKLIDFFLKFFKLN
ncbi:MAG: hypothetical protein ACFFDF_09735 [Candidatus Odinarchaeota archaeon]